jgi:ATP-dependent RNA helicase DDX5/DBP2
MTSAQVEEFRKEANMVISGKDVPKPVTKFTQAGFMEAVEKKLLTSGYAQPTPIQAQGWSMALSGKNMVGIAQTGSGKTLSFILPALVHIKGQAPLSRGDGPIALVLAPTRELAVQIQDVARVFGNTVRVNSTCLYGGAPKSVQIRNVRQGCEIIIATPGRLLDLLNENVFTLERCSFLVLDEADRMLDMGFEPQIRQILNRIRTDRQVLMWSATWPKNVMRLAQDMLGRDFIQVKIGTSELQANKKIKQTIVMCEPMEKKEKLTKMMMDIWESIPEPTDGQKKQMVRTIIFCNKKSTVDSITRSLYQEYWPVVSIHGDKAQYERDQAIRMLKSGEASILVATDVAARGLDVKDVMMVINFDMCDIENYVHRIGRTARGLATEGTALSLFTSEDAKIADDLIKLMQDAGQEVPENLAAMRRRGGGGNRYGGYASYGRGRSGSHSGPRSHVRFNPY